MHSSKLTHAALLAAVVGAAAAVTVSGAKAADAGKPNMPMEKCFGVAKAGENSCASANGKHGCATQSKTAFNGHEFKMVPAGTCEQMMGSLKPFDGANPKIKG